MRETVDLLTQIFFLVLKIFILKTLPLKRIFRAFQFVPTDTLDHLKECGKATKKSKPVEAVAEMSSTKGLRLLPLVHELQVSKPVDNNIMYVRALCWASYKKV